MRVKIWNPGSKFNIYNLLHLYYILNHIQVDIIYTDFAKTFERVDHGSHITNPGLANHLFRGANPI